MPRRLLHATCWIALAALAAGCVEVEVRRTLAPDRSGRQTVRLRCPGGAPADQALETFPGAYRGATVQPTRKDTTGGAATYSALVTFPDVTRLRCQAGFLHSTAAIETTQDGTLLYRETLGNGYLNSLAKAPDAARKEALAAEVLRTRAALEKASLAYTISFPGPIVKSNADKVSGSEATWHLTVDRLFEGCTLELTAEYQEAPEAVAAAPEVPKVAAPARRPVTAPALAPRPAPRVVRSNTRPLAAPDGERDANLDGMVLAQAEGEKPEAEKKEPEAELPQPEPKVTSLEPEPGDSETTRQIKELFSKALTHLDRKEYEKATKTLQEAIALNPDSVVVANLYKRAVSRFIDAILETGDPEFKAAAEKLLRMAEKGRIEQLRQPDYVQELVKSLSKGFLTRTFAMEELILAGDYAVPHLIDFIIRNEDPQLRSYAAYVLGNLGPVAVPAVCECLKCPDPMAKQIVTGALEKMGDARAVPMLLWAAQDPRGHPLVVSSARKAIAKIAKDPAIFETHAPLAFLTLAERYYQRDRKVLTAHLYEHLVWQWHYGEGKLVSESVPQPLYPYRMAEVACRNALLAEPSFEPAVPLIVCTYFAQQNFLEDFFESIEGQELTPELRREAELARPIRERLKHAPLVAHASGPKFIYAALRRSLRDGRTDIAVSCIDALEQVADGAALPEPPPPPEVLEKMKEETEKKERKKRGGVPLISWWGDEPEQKPEETEEDRQAQAGPYALDLDGTPLVEALSYAPHRKVRYRAAEAIVAVNPHHEILDGPKVIANLTEALAETAERVALLVDDDKNRADQIRGLLRECAVTPVLASSQLDALKRAKELPPKDLLVLSAGMKDIEVATLLANLRQVYTLAATPAIIVTTKGDLPALRKRLAKEDVAFLTTPFDKQSVQAAVEQVLAKSPEPKGSEMSVAYSASAARTLASIDPATSVFAVEKALPALLKAIASRTHPDKVRIPATRAVQHIGAADAVSPLVAAYKDPKSSKPLQLALLEAIGACAAAAPALPQDAAEVLAGASAHQDFDYRAAAARALGLAGGTPDTVPTIDRLHGRKPNVPQR
ncbi:MAG: HEAT repeat domain-containing protein [Planctomycetota bacterium]